MTTMLLSDKYRDRLDGVLHCYDRIVLTPNCSKCCSQRKPVSLVSLF